MRVEGQLGSLDEFRRNTTFELRRINAKLEKLDKMEYELKLIRRGLSAS